MHKPLTLTIPHKLSEAEVKSRIEGALADVRRRYPAQLTALHTQWASETHLDFSLSALSQSVNGRIDLLPQVLRLEIDLPWALSLLGSGLSSRIRKEAKRLLT